MTTADRIDPVYEPVAVRAAACSRRLDAPLARRSSLALLLVFAPIRAAPPCAPGLRRHRRSTRATPFAATTGPASPPCAAQAAAERNPLAMWVDYWELSNRINEVQPAEFAAFAQRWSGTYVEDRLRNDWLLELVRRRDRATFAAEFPRFRMNDDREVTCFALANDQLSGKDVRDAGVAAWLAQKDADDGCAFLAATLADAKQLAPADVWKKVRASIEAGKPRAARQAAGAAVRQQSRQRSPRSPTARRATSPRRPARRRAPMPS